LVTIRAAKSLNEVGAGRVVAGALVGGRDVALDVGFEDDEHALSAATTTSAAPRTQTVVRIRRCVPHG
jgi:hypothetical protein